MRPKLAKVYKDYILFGFKTITQRLKDLFLELFSRLVHPKYPLNSAIVILHGPKIKKYVILNSKWT